MKKYASILALFVISLSAAEGAHGSGAGSANQSDVSGDKSKRQGEQPKRNKRVALVEAQTRVYEKGSAPAAMTGDSMVTYFPRQNSGLKLGETFDRDTFLALSTRDNNPLALVSFQFPPKNQTLIFDSRCAFPVATLPSLERSTESTVVEYVDPRTKEMQKAVVSYGKDTITVNPFDLKNPPCILQSNALKPISSGASVNQIASNFDSIYVLLHGKNTPFKINVHESTLEKVQLKPNLFKSLVGLVFPQRGAVLTGITPTGDGLICVYKNNDFSGAPHRQYPLKHPEVQFAAAASLLSVAKNEKALRKGLSNLPVRRNPSTMFQGPTGLIVRAAVSEDGQSECDIYKVTAEGLEDHQGSFRYNSDNPIAIKNGTVFVFNPGKQQISTIVPEGGVEPFKLAPWVLK